MIVKRGTALPLRQAKFYVKKYLSKKLSRLDFIFSDVEKFCTVGTSIFFKFIVFQQNGDNGNYFANIVEDKNELKTETLHAQTQNKLPYFIEYSAHFFTLKMMLKYSLHTIHGR
jgi:hypothetical protein